jgi:alkylation response protein AidB-like acyl-CoA dehydrogenase
MDPGTGSFDCASVARRQLGPIVRAADVAHRSGRQRMGRPVLADGVVRTGPRVMGRRRRERRAAGRRRRGDTPWCLAAPTLLAFGSDELLARTLRPILTGEHRYCQLFSEPTNGSDLAGLRTRAERDGDEYVVSGQKLWTTSAHHADYAILLARTDPSVPKHAGLSFFVLPMHQSGVEVRPLRQMNGHASFNEVFLTEARIPAANLVGAEGDGWKVALTTLAHERGFATMRRRTYRRDGGRALDEAAAEAEDHFATYAWYPQRAGRPDLLAAEAARRDVRTDETIRSHIVSVVALQRVSEYTARRAAAARALGRQPGPEGSLGKLAASAVARAAALGHSRIAGAHGMLAATGQPDDDVVSEVLVSVPAQSIAGGTDEIQRNIVGERVLGLPKEPDPGPVGQSTRV